VQKLGSPCAKAAFFRTKLDRIQKEIDDNPFNKDPHDEQCVYLQGLNATLRDGENLLKQRSKINWLKDGDKNTKYFHRVVKARNNSNHIATLITRREW